MVVEAIDNNLLFVRRVTTPADDIDDAFESNGRLYLSKWVARDSQNICDIHAWQLRDDLQSVQLDQTESCSSRDGRLVEWIRRADAAPHEGGQFI